MFSIVGAPTGLQPSFRTQDSANALCRMVGINLDRDPLARSPQISEGLTISSHSMTTARPVERPNVSGLYISSALVGAARKVPGVVARAV